MAFFCLSVVLYVQSVMALTPMAITLGNPGLTVRNLNFPAVTICNDKVADRWFFIEALLNVVDLSCQKEVFTSKIVSTQLTLY